MNIINMIAFINSLGLGISITLSIVYIDKYKNIGDFKYKQLSLIYMIISGLFIVTFVAMKNTL